MYGGGVGNSGEEGIVLVLGTVLKVGSSGEGVVEVLVTVMKKVWFWYW